MTYRCLIEPGSLSRFNRSSILRCSTVRPSGPVGILTVALLTPEEEIGVLLVGTSQPTAARVSRETSANDLNIALLRFVWGIFTRKRNIRSLWKVTNVAEAPIHLAHFRVVLTCQIVIAGHYARINGAGHIVGISIFASPFVAGDAF